MHAFWCCGCVWHPVTTSLGKGASNSVVDLSTWRCCVALCCYLLCCAATFPHIPKVAYKWWLLEASERCMQFCHRPVDMEVLCCIAPLPPLLHCHLPLYPKGFIQRINMTSGGFQKHQRGAWNSVINLSTWRCCVAFCRYLLCCAATFPHVQKVAYAVVASGSTVHWPERCMQFYGGVVLWCTTTSGDYMNKSTWEGVVGIIAPHVILMCRGGASCSMVAIKIDQTINLWAWWSL